ncbi:hypothetical protein PPSIR1_10235 [Plesiocystis pacifica SIR-1]|uniref:Transcription factor zinc-finger domain-containing protein n=1 Tax=Plesiocystis pacifica SIR-1 TaxID=391625 RepID=A6GFE9_9BACT|nr:zf-TFIIB domain-containing protein [Plesiocystis pacifica]EDM75376.1 hypothetical protein PPSIR1_10235 [Plesiocystis pacifica SIR-1]
MDTTTSSPHPSCDAPQGDVGPGQCDLCDAPPLAASDGPSELNCAGCTDAMTPRALDPRLAAGGNSVYRGAEHRIHGCQSCGGTWVTRSTLEAIIRESQTRTAVPDPRTVTRQTARMADEVVYRSCPVCAQIMNRRNFAWISGIIVDECPSCGTYFDAGELEGVIHFVRSGGLLLARKHPQAGVPRAEDPQRRAQFAQLACAERRHAGSGKLVLMTDYDEIDLLIALWRWAGRWLREVAREARSRLQALR